MTSADVISVWAWPCAWGVIFLFSFLCRGYVSVSGRLGSVSEPWKLPRPPITPAAGPR